MKHEAGLLVVLLLSHGAAVIHHVDVVLYTLSGTPVYRFILFRFYRVYARRYEDT